MTDESVMSRITKLLALAADESTSPHERLLAEERAERLMAQHMIDRFEAEQHAKRGDTNARRPVQDTWEVMMSEVGEDSTSEFDYAVIDMMKYVLEHCNVRVNHQFKWASDYRTRIYTIIGFQEDIAYAERIWFNVFKAFVNNVNPKWNLNKSIEENAYTFASAGVSWKQQVLIAEAAGDTRLEWPWRYHNNPNLSDNLYTTWRSRIGEPIDPGNVPWGKSIHKLKRACKKHCDVNGLSYPYAGGSRLRIATRTSFARSYRSTIKQRLDHIRNAVMSKHDGWEYSNDVDKDKFALAVRDTRERVDEEFYRIFPEYAPEAQERRRAEREFLRACEWAALTPEEQQKVLRDEQREDEKWQRKLNRYRALREDPADRIDRAAWARGMEAAQSVNLRADGEVHEEQPRKAIK